MKTFTLLGISEQLQAATARAGGSFVAVSPEQLHALGRDLKRVLDGENAHEVFGQGDLRKRQARAATTANTARVYVYWWARALGRTKRAALDLALAHIPQKAPDQKSLLRYASRWRKRALQDVVDMPYTLPDGTVEKGPTQAQVDKLIAHLADKSRRGRDVD